MISSYSAVRHLASAVFPFSDKDKYMLMLNAVFDETGSDDDPDVPIVGLVGCMASAGLWEKTEIQWVNALEKFGLQSPFHMSDFAHSVKPYKAWKGKQEQRDELINALWDVVADLKPYFIGCLTPSEQYQKELPPNERRDLLGLHYQSYVRCLRVLFTLAEKGYGNLERRVQPVFEYKPDVAGEMYKIFDAAMRDTNNRYKQIVAVPVFLEKDKSVALQIPDLIAYECQKELKRRLYSPQFEPRLGFRRLEKIIHTQFGRKIIIGGKNSPISFDEAGAVFELSGKIQKEIQKRLKEK